MGRYIVGITGASGSVYGIRVIQELLKRKHEVHVVVTDSGEKVLEFETDRGLSAWQGVLEKECGYTPMVSGECGQLKVHAVDNLFAGIASGSFHTDGMVVVPCSMSTLAEIAGGWSKNLLTRSADVCIKERRKLVLVPRETPLSQIHLRNMLILSEAGVVLLPAMPGFYHKPEQLMDLVDFVVGKILDALDIDNKLYQKWSGEEKLRS